MAREEHAGGDQQARQGQPAQGQPARNLPVRDNQEVRGRQARATRERHFTILSAVVGFVVSVVDQIVIQGSMEIWAYLLIIFLIIIPGVAIGLVVRRYGYAYILGFLAGGFVGVFTIDAYIGWTSFFSALFIFLIIWLIFWKIWRSIASVQGVQGESRPIEKE